MLASKVDFYRNEDGLKSVMALASNQIGTELKRQQFWLVTEDSLTINVVDVGDYTLMWTPTQALVPPLGYPTTAEAYQACMIMFYIVYING